MNLKQKIYAENQKKVVEGKIAVRRALLKEKGFEKIKVYRPVDFGLLPKLLKSQHSFKTLFDYRAWFRISRYHLLSKLCLGNFSPTSSMVIYAFK